MNSRERFLAACWMKKPLDRPPVWMMRQAGRYLPEYRAIRAKHSFLEMCKTPDLAAEVTMQPIRRFGMDAAIIFSDILIVPEAMGISISYEEGGPRLDPVISTRADLERLRVPVDGDLQFTCDALRLVRAQLGETTALLGFAGAPYTLASYMLESGSPRELMVTKSLQYSNPDLLKGLLDRLADAVAWFLEKQVAAGADAVQIFDTWAGNLCPADYREFALPYVARVIARLRRTGVPVILYINGVAGVLEAASTSGATVMGIDWRMDLKAADGVVGDRAALQGNLDPVMLFAPAARIRDEVRRAHSSLSRRSGHIFNLGHGILPSTPLEGAAAFVDAVRELH